MTNEDFAEGWLAKKVPWEQLMNPQGVPYLELQPPPEPEPSEPGEQGQLW